MGLDFMNQTNLPFYRKVLRDELAARVAQNPLFSLRCFAAELKLDPGTISRILAGKRVPTHKNVEKICIALNITGDKKKEFLASVVEAHTKLAAEAMGFSQRRSAARRLYDARELGKVPA